jgi:hypothetical protein
MMPGATQNSAAWGSKFDDQILRSYRVVNRGSVFCSLKVFNGHFRSLRRHVCRQDVLQLLQEGLG